MWSHKKRLQIIFNDRQILFENYLAVTLGHPKRDGVTENIDIFMEKIPDKSNHNDKPVIEPVLTRELMSRWGSKNIVIVVIVIV